MCSGSCPRGKSRAPASGKTGTRSKVPRILSQQDRGEPPPLRPGPGIFEPDRLDQLQQPLARRALVPVPVAGDAVEQLVGGGVAGAACGEDAGELVARLEIVGIGG